MYTDRIDLTLPEADLQQILAFLLSCEELLAPLRSVSPSDRKHLAKLGLKNEGLARQIIEVGRANPGLIPRDIDFEPIDRDLLARDQLRSLKVLLERLLGRINDSLLLTGVDIYAAALSIYHCLKRNGETASLRAVVEELKQGFARPSRKKKGEEQTEMQSTAQANAVPPVPNQGTTSVATLPAPVAPKPQAVHEPVPVITTPQVKTAAEAPVPCVIPAANTYLLRHSPHVTLSTADRDNHGSIDGRFYGGNPPAFFNCSTWTWKQTAATS